MQVSKDSHKGVILITGKNLKAQKREGGLKTHITRICVHTHNIDCELHVTGPGLQLNTEEETEVHA